MKKLLYIITLLVICSCNSEDIPQYKQVQVTDILVVDSFELDTDPDSIILLNWNNEKKNFRKLTNSNGNHIGLMN